MQLKSGTLLKGGEYKIEKVLGLNFSSGNQDVGWRDRN